MSKTVFTLLAGVLLAFPASAQELRHATAVGLSWSRIDLDGADASGPGLDVESELRFGQWTADLAFAYERLEDDGDAARVLSFSAAPTYWLTEGFGIGAYAARDSIDLGIGDVVNLDSYGLEASFRGPAFEARVHAGKTDLDEFASLVDVTDIGFQMRYDLADRVGVWGSAVRTAFDAGGNSTSARSLGIGANLKVTDSLDAFASRQSTRVDDGAADLDMTAVGLSYTTGFGGRPVILSGEYGFGSFDSGGGGDDLDRISVGATILLGDAQSKRVPGHAVSQGVLDGPRSAIGGLFGVLGF